MSEEQAAYIAQSLEPEEDNSRSIEFRDPIKQLGFAAIYHIITLDSTLSDGAFRAYVLLHFYWQQKHIAWPNVQTLAQNLGVDESTARRYLKELTDKQLISRKRRMGKSSMTILEDIPQAYADAASAVLGSRKSHQSAQKQAVSPLKNEPTEEQPYKNNQVFENAKNAFSNHPADLSSKEDGNGNTDIVQEEVHCEKKEKEIGVGVSKFGLNLPPSITNYGSDKKRGKPKAKRGQNLSLALAIAAVCNMDFEANKGRLLAETSRLMESTNPTPTKEIIYERYGKGMWWYNEDWRGKKQQPPTPGTIRETWGKWVDSSAKGTSSKSEDGSWFH